MSQSVTQTDSHGDIIGDESESRSGAVEVRRNRSKKRSFVWNHFEEAEDNMVVCRKCDTKLTANRTSGTTHLRRHIL